MEVQNPNGLSTNVWLMLVILGVVCLIVGWYRWLV
jgi:hypothetical protein